MSTRTFVMPRTPEIGTVDADGRVRLSEGFQGYMRGIEDVSKRVAANVTKLNGDTTAANMSAKIDAIITALTNSDSMKAS